MACRYGKKGKACKLATKEGCWDGLVCSIKGICEYPPNCKRKKSAGPSPNKRKGSN